MATLAHLTRFNTHGVIGREGNGVALILDFRVFYSSP